MNEKNIQMLAIFMDWVEDYFLFSYICIISPLRFQIQGSPGGPAVGQPWWPSGLAPPSAQGVILETQDGVPRWAPCVEPASSSACVSLSLCVSHE